MSKFHICTIRPPGFIHVDGFREMIDSLSWALSALNHEVVIAENSFSNTATNILFGAELLPKDQQVPRNTICYNLEQPSHVGFDNVRRLGADGYQIWDYNKRNTEQWKKLGFNAVHVPFGFTPNLAKIPKAKTADISVFFSGWITPRRQKIIDELKATSLNVVAVDSAYGGSRDNLISRSLLCLNINHDGRNFTNIQRLSHWMANSKCIVSEFSSDMNDYEDLLPSIVMCPYEDLVETCKNMLFRGSVAKMGQAAFDAFSRRDYTAYVAAALEAQPAKNPILERYERGCLEGDMKEYLPWLKKNSYGRILEIGVRDGASTAAILLGLEEHGGYLHSIDVADCSGLWKHPRWGFECGDSKAAKFPDNEFDMALIDGDHTKEGFLTDLHNCYRWVRSGGFIACHDIEPSRNFESCGGDFPSLAVGREYRKFVGEKQLVNFELPGVQGMGVFVVKK